MPRKLKIAAIQMDATPAPVTERLARAGDLVAEAASAGAQLVVLPEVFNTGYQYDDANYALAEDDNGPTLAWLHEQATTHGVHLVGSMLYYDVKDIYNTAFLIAPDGRRWRYDKNYPWIWERAYFREGHGPTIAETDIGTFGMMICWDYAHSNLWAEYAGKVDAIIVPASPPQGEHFDVLFPDGTRVNFNDLGPLSANAHPGEGTPFGDDFNAQTAWLGVPSVLTTGTGTFHSNIPAPRFSVNLLTAMRPGLWKYRRGAKDVVLEGGYYLETKIVDAEGTVQAHLDADEEGYVMAEVDLADEKPQPTTDQPEIPFSLPAYLFADYIAPTVLERTYRRGVRALYGRKTAPRARVSRQWWLVLILVIVGALGWLLRRIGAGRGKDPVILD